MPRPKSTRSSCMLASLVLLCSLSLTARASDSSSTHVSLTPPPSSSPGRADGGGDSQEKPVPAEPRRRIRDLGLLEGRERDTHFLHDPTIKVADDEVEGPYAGRNRKKKKHRIIHAVEVQARKLEQSGGLKSDGSLDVAGLLKLASAQEERESAPGGVVRQKDWTLEELDLAYPTPEGNKRLGLQDEADLAPKAPRAKWERSSHLINMRAPGTFANLIPEDTLNYRRSWQNTTLLVLGSMGHVYTIVVQPCFSVGGLKEMVWELERLHRDAAQDVKDHFKIHRQRLILDRGSRPARSLASATRVPEDGAISGEAEVFEAYELGPDMRTLEWYNITDLDVLYVDPPVEKPSAEEQQAFEHACFDAAYEREINRRLAETEDSDDQDPDYRAVKQAYLAASEAAFQNVFLSNPVYAAGYAELQKNDPNFAQRPHPRMDPAGLAEAEAQLAEMMAPDFLEKTWEACVRETREEERTMRDGASLQDEPQAAVYDDDADEVGEEFLRDMQAQQFKKCQVFAQLVPPSALSEIDGWRTAEGSGAVGRGPAQEAAAGGRAAGAEAAGARGVAGVGDERPPWERRKFGVQERDDQGNLNEFEVDEGMVQELQAYKDKLVEAATQQQAQREGRKRSRQQGAGTKGRVVDSETHHPLALTE